MKLPTSPLKSHLRWPLAALIFFCLVVFNPFIGSQASAQPRYAPLSTSVAIPASLPSNQSISDTDQLDVTDQHPNSYYADFFRISVATAGTLEITMDSGDELDTYLKLFNASGEGIGANDDDDEGTLGVGSRIVYTVTEPGIYYIVASTFNILETGNYVLNVTSSTGQTNFVPPNPSMGNVTFQLVRNEAFSYQLAGGSGNMPGSALTYTKTSGDYPVGMTLNSSGQLSGTPTVAGTTTATIQVNDGNGTATGTLTIEVIDIVAAPASASTDEDTVKTFTGDEALFIGGDDETIVRVTIGVAHGTLTLGTTTDLTFTAGDGTDDATMTFRGIIEDLNTALATLSYAPTPDYNGADTLSASGTNSVTTVNDSTALTVNPIADIVTDNVNVGANASITFNPVTGTNGASADNFEGPTPTISSVTQGAEGTVVLGVDNSITYTPGAAFPGSDSFTYTVTSGGATETGTVNVTGTSLLDSSINLVKLTNGTDNNTAPGPSVIVGSTVTFTYSVTNTGEGTLSGVTVKDDNGTPANLGDDFNATYASGDTNANGKLDLTETWTFTATRIATLGQYTNIGTATGTPTSGPAVSDTDADNHLGIPDNAAPVATDGSAETDEDTPIEMDLATLVSDDKTSDANLIYTIVTPPAAGEGSVTLNGSKATYTPSANFNGGTSFTYQVEDEGGLKSAVKKVTISIASEEDAPVLAPIGNKSVDELKNLSFTATATDGDENVLTFSLQGAPSGASITKNGVFSWTPNEAQGPGSFTFKVRVYDGTSYDEEQITVTVREVNTAPVLELGGNRTLTGGVPFAFGITSYDVDIPAQGGGVYPVNAPSWINITNGPTVYGTPPVASSPYNVNLTLRAGDSYGAITQKSITLTVNSPRVVWMVEPTWDAGEGTLTYRLKNNTSSAINGVWISGVLRVPVKSMTKSIGSTSWNTQGNGYYGVYWNGFNLAAGREATLVIKVARPGRGTPVAQSLYCSYGPGSPPTLTTADVYAP